MAVMALNEGAQKRKALVKKAEGLTDAANRTKAVATAEMAEEQRLKEQMESRAIAVAAASGAGIDDPTMVQLIGDLNTEGEYRIMSRLFVGETEAEGLQEQSYAARREGEAALNAAYVKVVKSAISTFGGGFGGGSTPTPSSMSAVQSQPGGMEIPGYAPQGMNA
jgi:hypothetical protein